MIAVGLANVASVVYQTDSPYSRYLTMYFSILTVPPDGMIDTKILDVTPDAVTTSAAVPDSTWVICGAGGAIRLMSIGDVVEGLNGGIVPFREDARLDQVKGTRIAYEAGYSKVAVTIARADDAPNIRSEFPDVFIIAVHTTGITDEEALLFADYADIVTACASRAVREVAATRALLQAGSYVPVFAMTQKAKELILRKVMVTEGQFLVTGAKLPFGSDTLPKPLV